MKFEIKIELIWFVSGDLPLQVRDAFSFCFINNKRVVSILAFF
tara:strand:- start:217 stop:345 length:129 start_codon:yes stop_codon:yes gene_type:complete